jgi:hypothetical protein
MNIKNNIKLSYLKYIMNILHYIFFINSIHNADLYFIENLNKPICANCKFFIKNKNECSVFSDVNIISGKYTFEKAFFVRNDENKCGEYALFYKKNHFKFITDPYYFILDNWILVSFFSIYGILFTSLIVSLWSF